jgi:ribosomal protein S18 acetylase RimI-like enzyme
MHIEKTSPVIRTAIREDLPALEWNGDYIHFRRLYAEAYKRTEKGRGLIWVIEMPGEGIIGQALVQLLGSRTELANGTMRAYVYAVRVRPSFRGNGYGTRLMQRVENDLFERGFSVVTLNVAKENVKARRLYERLGYQVVAADRGRWSYIDHQGKRQHVHEPAWRMEKNLLMRTIEA